MQWYAPTTMDGVQDTMEMPARSQRYTRRLGCFGFADMNGAKVTVYVTNCGNGTADIQAIMEGTSRYFLCPILFRDQQIGYERLELRFND